MEKTEDKKIENVTPSVVVNNTKPAVTPFNRTFQDGKAKPHANFGKSMYGNERAKNPRKNFGGRAERVKPEFDQNVINIRRVTRVTKGGKRLSFSVAMVAGNKKGSVGIGTGKAGDTSLAIDKAFRNAQKNMITLNLTKTMSIPHDVSAKYSSGRVMIIPAPGRGVSAGSAVRSVLELGGINDVTAKIISPSKNKLNIARATIDALSAFNKKNNPVVDTKEVVKKAIKAEPVSTVKVEIKK